MCKRFSCFKFLFYFLHTFPKLCGTSQREHGRGSWFWRHVRYFYNRKLWCVLFRYRLKSTVMSHRRNGYRFLCQGYWRPIGWYWWNRQGRFILVLSDTFGSVRSLFSLSTRQGRHLEGGVIGREIIDVRSGHLSWVRRGVVCVGLIGPTAGCTYNTWHNIDQH